MRKFLTHALSDCISYGTFRSIRGFPQVPQVTVDNSPWFCDTSEHYCSITSAPAPTPFVVTLVSLRVTTQVVRALCRCDICSYRAHQQPYVEHTSAPLGAFICLCSFYNSLMKVYTVRLTTFSCDDGVGEDDYHDFATREQADAFASCYGDDPIEVAVFPRETVPMQELPF